MTCGWVNYKGILIWKWTKAQCKGGGVYLIAMYDVINLINYAHSDWLIISFKDLFIEHGIVSI